MAKFKHYTGDFTPAEYVVFVHNKSGRSRIGGYATLSDAYSGIARNEEARADSLGGLIAPSTEKVEYSVWRCTKWEQVK